MTDGDRKYRRDRERAAARLAEDRARGLLDEAAPTPLSALVSIARERDRLAELEVAHVAALRSVGTPWAVIGRALGITGQAASRRYRGL